MKKLFVLAAIAAAFMLIPKHATAPIEVGPPTAQAAEKIQGALLSTDAGQTNVFCFANTNQPIKLESQTGDPFCYATCTTSTCAINTDAGTGTITPCISAYVVPPPPIVAYNSTDGGLARANLIFEKAIDMAQDKCVTAFAVDAGNPKLNVYLITRTNPNAGPSF